MPILPDWLSKTITDFMGPWQDVEASDVPANRGLLAQNIEYAPGQAKTRYGFGSVQTPGDVVTSMQNWISSAWDGVKNYLAYFATSGAHGGVNLLNLSSGAVTNLFSSTAAGAVFAQAGNRLYMAMFDANGLANEEGRVYANTISSTGAGKLFGTPISTAPSVSDSAFSGVCTAGTKLFGYVLTTRSGHVMRPSPVVVGQYTPVSFTTAGGKQITFQVTATWPTDVLSLQPIMTISGGSVPYLVPGVSAAVSPGSTSTVTVTINISDDDLAVDANDASSLFLQVTGGEILPSFVGEYKNRLYYIARDSFGVPVLAISNPDDFETMAEDENFVYLPGKRIATSGFVLDNGLYVVGPHWTYFMQDGGDLPVTWDRPQLLDGAIGSLSPLGTTVNSARGIAWVADVEGLYVFAGGSYASKPVSYYQKSLWSQIDWSQPGKIQVVDDNDTKRVRVLAPLVGGAVVLLTWDYTRGINFDQVSFSYDTLASYSPSAIATVQNDSTKRLEVWLGPNSAALPVLRQMNARDTNPYRDNGLAINSIYQTSLLPGLSAQPLKHHGDHMRLQGNGNVSITVNTLDGGRTIALTVLTEALLPAKVYLRNYHALSEAVSLTFATNTIDQWFSLSSLTHWFTDWLMER